MAREVVNDLNAALSSENESDVLLPKNDLAINLAGPATVVQEGMSVTDEEVISRRELGKRAAVGLIAIAEVVSAAGSITWFVRNATGKQRRLLTARDRFIQMLHSQPTAKEVLRQVPNLGTVIDLARERQEMGVEAEGLEVNWLDVGNSYTYMDGVRNDRGGLFEQPNAISSVAMNGLGEHARTALGMGASVVAACAQVGGYSGDAYPGDPSVPYGFLSQKQLGSSGVQAYLREGNGLKIERIDMGFDDLRLLVATSAELAASMSDITALLTDDKVARSTEAHLEQLQAQVPEIARQSGLFFERAAEISADISRIRIERGDRRIIIVPVICWDLRDQENMPINVLTGTLSPEAAKFLVPDPAGPDRYYLPAKSIPYGHDIAHWIWVEMNKAHNAAIARVIHQFGDAVAVVPENLVHVNRHADFYASPLGNNGHPGPNGIVEAAHEELTLLANTTEQGTINASALANLKVPT